MFGRLLRGRRRRGAEAAVPATAPAGAALASMSTKQTQSLLRRLEWTVVRRLDGLLQGDYRTLFRGFGLDLADLREYRPGDDVRHIDWNVTARLQTPHVREFQEDRDLSAWFVLDLSGSVEFGSGPVRKRDLLSDFTTVMALLLTRYGNRIGAVLYGGAADLDASVIPPRSGRRQLLHLLDRMHATPAVCPGETRLRDLLERARAVAKRRSVVFVVSDFISAPGWQVSLAMLARRHEVVAVRLVDPLEMALPDLGLVVLQDAETAEQMFVDTHDPAFRKRFAAVAEAREAELRLAFARAGVECLTLSTYAPIDLALLQFTRERRFRQGAARGAA
ncbi:ATPase [Cupriavidus sp. UYMMa02A]|nr:ATPase [Cupriavidus sp. UYMMa02A]